MKMLSAVGTHAFAHKNVLLIDDVATTGATLDACTRSLKEAEADTVWGLTFSRDVKIH